MKGSRWLLTACTIVLLCGAIAIGTAGAAAPVEAIGVATTIDETVDETTAELDETTEETTEEFNETVGETADELNETIGETTEELNQTSDETTEELDETVNETTEELNQTVGETTDELSETVDETTDELSETVNETTDVLDETVDETTDILNQTVAETTDTLDGTIEEPIEMPSEEGSEPADSDPEPIEEDESEAEENESEAEEPLEHALPSDDGIDGIESEAGGDGVQDERAPVDDTASTAAPTGAESDAGIAVATVLSVIGWSVGGAGTAGVPLIGSGLSRTVGRTVRLRSVGSVGGRPWEYVAAVFRYSRYDDSDPLAHADRRALFERIGAQPGVYLTELDGTSDRSLSTIRHHVRVLEAERLITTEKVRGKRRCFPVGSGNVALEAALAEPASRQVLETLHALDVAHNKQLATELDRHPSTVAHHLSRLEADGLIQRERDGRLVVNRLDPAVARKLAADDPAGAAD